MSESPLVAIIVLNYNGKADTFECIESLAKITYTNYKVFLVDNGSKEPIVDEAALRFPWVKVIDIGENRGYTGGNNAGCKAAIDDGAKYVLILNNDTVVKNDFLEHLVSICERDEHIAMASPKIYCYGEDKKIWTYGAKWERLFGNIYFTGMNEKDVGQYDHIKEVDSLIGCAILVKKDVIDKIGMLDDRFFLYGEETEWCIRANRAGYKMAVVPQSIIWHKGDKDASKLGKPFKRYLRTRNILLLLRKHCSYFHLNGIVYLLYTLWTSFKITLKAARRFIFSGDNSYLDIVRAIALGLVDGIRGRYGKPIYF